MAPPRVVLASANPKKAAEIRAILGDRFEVLIPPDLHLQIPPIVETDRFGRRRCDHRNRVR